MPSRWYRIGARLSLFAMLMALLGPLISQGTSLAHGAQPLDGAEVSGPASSSHAAHHHDCADHGPVFWERCGYCTLLFQHPPLTESQPFLAGAHPVSAVVPTARLLFRHIDPPVFPGSRTRAPPPLS